MTILIWYGVTALLCAFTFVLGSIVGRASMMDEDE